MRITVVEQNGTGGLAHYAYQICTALANEGHDVTLITAKLYELENFPHNFKLDRRLDLWDLFDRRVETLPRNALHALLRKVFWQSRRALRALKLITAWIGLTRFLEKDRPDIVQFGKMNFPFEALFLSHMKKNGLVLTEICHEFERRESSGLLSRYVDGLYRNIYTNYRAIFFHAQQNRDRFLTLFPEIPADRAYVIHHGNEGMFLSLAADVSSEDLRLRYRLGDGEKVVLFFGLLAPSKGLPVLIRAMEKVTRTDSVRLLIAGYPAKNMDLAELYDLVEACGLKESVIFDVRYIPIGEVSALMELASMVIFPYLSSTQSGSLQVAYSFGKPVIATRVGGLAEAVEDDRNGYLVPVDDPDILAEKINTLLHDTDLAARMGQYNKDQSETLYSWKPVAKTITAVYRNLIQPE
jgi:glycosyltransferase involved in cell wall biosynthesis